MVRFAMNLELLNGGVLRLLLRRHFPQQPRGKGEPVSYVVHYVNRWTYQARA